jgi:hypothetical protein
MKVAERSAILAMYVLPVLPVIVPSELLYSFYRLPFILLIVVQIVVLAIFVRQRSPRWILLAALPVVALLLQIYHIVSLTLRCAYPTGFCFA